MNSTVVTSSNTETATWPITSTPRKPKRRCPYVRISCFRPGVSTPRVACRAGASADSTVLSKHERDREDAQAACRR